jgi:hypothetical protein
MEEVTMAGELSHRGEFTGQENVSYFALLNLRPEDLNELRRQGFVAKEVRAGKSYFRLQFRRHGRQVVIGLGKDPELAERVGRELAQLQAERLADRKQKRLIRAAHDLLRRSKHELESALHCAGYAFYGYEIRKPRARREELSSQQEASTGDQGGGN